MATDNSDRKMKYLLLISSLLISCSSVDKHKQELTEKYYSELKKNLIKDEKHSGLKNVFTYHASIMTKNSYQLKLDKEAYENLWDEATINKHKQEYLQNISNSTEVILSFFTPEKKNNKLEGGQSVWRIFLDVENKRYIGKIKKMKGNPSKLRGLYPFHNPWSRLYSVRFPVAVDNTKNKNIVFTVTGNLGVSRQKLQIGSE